MDGKRTLVLLLDAFRKDYIINGEMNFLHDLDKKFNGCEVQQSFGFCERTEILHGKTPEDEGFFTAIALKKNKKAFYSKSRILLSSILKNETINKIVRIGLRILFRLLKIKIPLYKIPIAEIGMWEFTEDKIDITKPNNFKNSPLLNLTKNYNVSFTHFTSLDKPVVIKDDNKRLFKSLDEFEKNDIVFVYYGLTDYLAHVYGPNSEVFNQFLKSLDENIHLLHNELVKKNIKLTILGDHGMMEVKSQFNVQIQVGEILKNINLIHSKDYITFTDSTLHRIYLNDKSKIKLITNLLNESLNHRISIHNNSIYGDIIIEANTGELFYPNNFNPSPLKGMHGYRSKSKENKGYFVSELNMNNNKIEGDLDLKDFMYNLNELLRKCI